MENWRPRPRAKAYRKPSEFSHLAMASVPTSLVREPPPPPLHHHRFVTSSHAPGAQVRQQTQGRRTAAGAPSRRGRDTAPPDTRADSQAWTARRKGTSENFTISSKCDFIKSVYLLDLMLGIFKCTQSANTDIISVFGCLLSVFPIRKRPQGEQVYVGLAKSPFGFFPIRRL